jgi:AraC-like DNA-binding protein
MKKYLKITDICYKCGFGSLNQFNRVFKKVMKMPPGKYRSSVIGEDGLL